MPLGNEEGALDGIPLGNEEGIIEGTALGTTLGKQVGKELGILREMMMVNPTGHSMALH